MADGGGFPLIVGAWLAPPPEPVVPPPEPVVPPSEPVAPPDPEDSLALLKPTLSDLVRQPLSPAEIVSKARKAIIGVRVFINGPE